MKQHPISRRTLLKGVGAAIALPALEVMGTLSAATATAPTPPVRLAYLYFPNGVARGGWAPARVGEDGRLIELNRWMKPLQPFAEHLVLPERLWTPRGNGHVAGTATWLTGGSYDRRRIDAGGVSVDQLAAQQIGRDTLLPSLELSLKGEGHFANDLPRNTLSWSASGRPVPREVEPRVIFDRMFRPGDGAAVDRSVLDSVSEHAKSLRRQVSNADQRKLDEYLESIRGVERRLDFAEQQAKRAKQAGDLADSLVRPAPGIPTSHEGYMRLMLDMMALAFWADATRVSTLMLDHGQSNRYFDFIDGVRGTWHALSHYRDISGKTEDDDGQTSWDSVASKRDMYNAVTRWHHEQVAYFLGRLASIKEGEGTLLDNTLILYGSSLADGHEHGEKQLPVLLAGNAAGRVRSGRQLSSRDNQSMSDLHLAMLQLAGVQLDSFAESQQPLAGLLR